MNRELQTTSAEPGATPQELLHVGPARTFGGGFAGGDDAVPAARQRCHDHESGPIEEQLDLSAVELPCEVHVG